MLPSRVLEWINVIFLLAIRIANTQQSPDLCTPDEVTFELITGYVFSSPSGTLDSRPETLVLDDCLRSCRRNSSCVAVNYETGLCVLFTSHADHQPGALTLSQFPVFTLYAQKVCLKGVRHCLRNEWTMERVPGHELVGYVKKHRRVVSRHACAQLCLLEQDFRCRSVNYEPETGDCQLNDMDRFTIGHPRAFQGRDYVDYMENNCIEDPARLCEYQKVDGKIMKTVDAVFRNVTSLDGCRRLCSAAPFRCHSFDFGATESDVCRLSHHSTASLSIIDEPYLPLPSAATYELSACYNVSVECRAADMVAKIRTNKMFNGKIYAKTRPRSCVIDVSNSLDFELRMAYTDINCDVKHDGYGAFSNDIVLQHHDLIVTNQDLGLSVHCQYDLQNKSVSNGVNLNIQGEMKNMASEAGTVPSPNVSMKITDRDGDDIGAAQVGDPLSLRFEIIDRNSPYEIFVRELVASDGLPGSSEILLIDSLGCPTDQTIMGPLLKVNENGQILDAYFDAFKFPLSEMVHFKALVTPCLPTCEPVQCSLQEHDGSLRNADSYGKRKRRAIDITQQMSPPNNTQDVMLLAQSIKIRDRFGFQRTPRKLGKDWDNDNDVSNEDMEAEPITGKSTNVCINIMGLIFTCSFFLIAQLALLFAWLFLWQRRRRGSSNNASTCQSIESLYNGYTHK